MEYSKEILTKVMQCGIFGYQLKKILNIIDITESEKKEFKKDFNNKNSILSIQYKKGLDRGDYILDSKLFDLAQNGDRQSFELFQERKEKRIIGFEDDYEFEEVCKKNELTKQLLITTFRTYPKQVVHIVVGMTRIELTRFIEQDVDLLLFCKKEGYIN